MIDPKKIELKDRYNKIINQSEMEMLEEYDEERFKELKPSKENEIDRNMEKLATL